MVTCGHEFYLFLSAAHGFKLFEKGRVLFKVLIQI